MQSEQKSTVLMIGAIIGAILGTGAAYLMLTAPSDDDDKPIEAKDLLGFVAAASGFVRLVDDLRRRL